MDHNSDHLPITTRLDIIIKNQLHPEVHNWASTDEKKLQTVLERELLRVKTPKTRAALDRYTAEVVAAIQAAVNESTPLRRYSPRARSGWTNECKEVQAEARRLKRETAKRTLRKAGRHIGPPGT